MANLIRGRQDFLLNDLTKADVGVYYGAGDVPHLVFKSLGIDISAPAKVKILNAVSGVKQKVKLEIDWLWDGSPYKVFEIEVTKQPAYSGWTNEQFPISHTYSYMMPAFTTNTIGTLVQADKQAIVDGLVAAITADVKVNANAVNTGAVVNATRSTDDLILEAKEDGVVFSVRIYNNEFTQTQLVAPQKATLTNDLITQLFAVKAENEGQRVTQPLVGTAYAKIQIEALTPGYDNTSATAYNERSQVYNIYLPASLVDTALFAPIAYADGNGVVASMADSGGAESESLADYLELVTNTVLPVSVEAASTGSVSASTDFNLGATVVVHPSTASQKVTYSSATAARVTVDADGVCKKGSSTGASVITITTVNGKTTTCTVTAS